MQMNCSRIFVSEKRKKWLICFFFYKLRAENKVPVKFSRLFFFTCFWMRDWSSCVFTWSVSVHTKLLGECGVNEHIYCLRYFSTTFISCQQISNVKGKKNRKAKIRVDFIFVITKEEQTMNCPFSVIMVPVLCPSQVQYYDNWRLAVPSQYTPPRQTTQPVTLSDVCFIFKDPV